jgi:hypothetical protein
MSAGPVSVVNAADFVRRIRAHSKENTLIWLLTHGTNFSPIASVRSVWI